MENADQHQLTLPSSPVGKSSDLHAGVQQFRAQVFLQLTHSVEKIVRNRAVSSYRIVCMLHTK